MLEFSVRKLRWKKFSTGLTLRFSLHLNSLHLYAPRIGGFVERQLLQEIKESVEDVKGISIEYETILDFATYHGMRDCFAFNQQLWKISRSQYVPVDEKKSWKRIE